MKDFGTSESPKSNRSSTTHWCPGRSGQPAFRHNIASSLRLHTGLPYDWTPRSDAPLGSPLAPSARRVSRVASRLPGTTRLRFALHGGQRRRCHRRGHHLDLPSNTRGGASVGMAAFSCGLTEAHEGSRARVRIESTQISAFFSVGYHAQQGVFILLGSEGL